ncbi:hypothetical protein CSHISOI_09947 [Colletotrichum shisoi]|uniref:Uncharacterized protein n=1 Tax=Colletotrichum shisoi TaxID=2078593 RepID=A0A5Q4BEE0_9PEZI|nr:hypothetical protein CSHISOI_09947 [Colletotrichum shisoi]
MQLSYLYAALFLAVGATAQTCTGSITYCTGSVCNCFYEGVGTDLNNDCKDKGFQKSLGPSRTTTGTVSCVSSRACVVSPSYNLLQESRCVHQCCNN